MARITGLGGVFLNVRGDTRALLDWYHDVLALQVGQYGIGFLEPNVFTLITFDGHLDGVQLNFTVDDLEAFLELLRARGVRVTQDISDYDYGRFAQIADPLGNLIELWQPHEEAYRAMGQAEAGAYEAERNRTINRDVQDSQDL